MLQTLARAGLLISRRGADGGFELAPGTEQVTMLDVIQAVDGPVQLNVCLHGNGACERAANCLARPVWARAQEAMLAVLGTTMIGDLADPSRTN